MSIPGPAIRRQRWSFSRRRGSAYVLVLSAGVIVSLISISAITVSRIEMRSIGSTGDSIQARLNALSAVDHGLMIIQKNPSNWRTMLSGGDISGQMPSGECLLLSSDPVDGDIGNNTSDPIEFIGIGSQGTARCKLRVLVGADTKQVAGTWEWLVD